MSNKDKKSSDYRKERNATRKNRDIDRQKKTQNYISEDFSIREGDFDDAKVGKYIIKNTTNYSEEKKIKNSNEEQLNETDEDNINNVKNLHDNDVENLHDDEYEYQLEMMRKIELKKTIIKK